MYLATVIDLYSRRVVGWSMSERMTAALVCDALRMALWRRRSPEGVIFHSDRGSQYCSGDFQRLIKTSKLLSSMSASKCATPCLNTLRQTTIGPADTAPTATSARKRLRHKKPLSSVSVVDG